MSELQALKAHSKARELQEKRLAERRRNALVLILRHLLDAGYLDSYERLSHEANISLKQVRQRQAAPSVRTSGCASAVPGHDRELPHLLPPYPCAFVRADTLQVDVADNISLLRILQEYEDAHEANYGTRVRLVRKSSAAAAGPPAEVWAQGRANTTAPYTQHHIHSTIHSTIYTAPYTCAVANGCGMRLHVGRQHARVQTIRACTHASSALCTHM